MIDTLQIWYDRQGEPIDAATADRLLGDRTYTRVALTEITAPNDDSARVSTVWRALRIPDIDPGLFETMVFGGRHDCRQERYDTEPEALAGHERTVAEILAQLPGATAKPAEQLDPHSARNGQSTP